MDLNGSTEGGEHFAFKGHRRVASGNRADVAAAVRDLAETGDLSFVLMFDDTGRQFDVDLSGSVEDVRRRAGATAPPRQDPAVAKKRGRPKLGVVGREITLLPRHWQWLETQRGGPSAALRRLVDQARGANRDRDRVREAQDAINRFLSAVAGDLPGFEEATRALYRGECDRFAAEIARWPVDVRSQVQRWMDDAFSAPVA